MARREDLDEKVHFRFYDAGYALNAEARRDRYEWLRTQINLRRLDRAVLDKVKEVK